MAVGLIRFAVRALIPELTNIFGSASRALNYLKTPDINLSKATLKLVPSEIRSMKRLGQIGSYRKTDYLQDWREINDIPRMRSAVKSVPRGKHITERAMTGTTKFLSDKYMHIAEVTFTNEFTGEPDKRNIAYMTDQILTKAELEDKFFEITRTAEGDSGKIQDVISIKVTDSYKQI